MKGVPEQVAEECEIDLVVWTRQIATFKLLLSEFGENCLSPFRLLDCTNFPAAVSPQQHIWESLDRITHPADRTLKSRAAHLMNRHFLINYSNLTLNKLNACLSCKNKLFLLHSSMFLLSRYHNLIVVKPDEYNINFARTQCVCNTLFGRILTL